MRGETMKYKRIVFKVGTSSLTNPDGSLSRAKVKAITQQLATLHEEGHELILVSSGAIAAGFSSLGFKKRPTKIADKQASAAVGQGLLLEEYTSNLLMKGIVSAQILLTQDDFVDKRRYNNAHQALSVLLTRHAIPIINENDTVSIEELKVGDNDTMSALVSGLIDADLVIILSDIDGLYNKNPQKYTDAKLIELVGDITEDVKNMAGGEGSKFGTGGMITKIIAAEMATKIGTNLVIANGDDPKNITRVVEKENIGTLFVRKNKKISSKKYWLAYGTNKKGIVTIDEGAEKALLNGKSLLPVGIKSVEGRFDEGAVIKIENLKKDNEIKIQLQ